MIPTFLGSVVRHVAFAPPDGSGRVFGGKDFTLGARPRDRWHVGDIVVARVVEASPQHGVFELISGRLARLRPGDHVMGALARRAATLEAVGSFEDVGEDGRMHILTGGGGFGRITSISPWIGPATGIEYVGHVHHAGRALSLTQVAPPVPTATFDIPIVCIIGSSMSSGKTIAGQAIVRSLVRMGHRVVAGKVTGAARSRDILSFRDAGAVAVHDFVDVGLASTVCDESVFRPALDALLAHLAGHDATVAVLEAGASPLEPYNGHVAMEVLDDRIACTVLAASDPFAVSGVVKAFGRKPDLVCGPAANTSAAVALVDALTGLTALDLSGPDAPAALEGLLRGLVGGGG